MFRNALFAILFAVPVLAQEPAPAAPRVDCRSDVPNMAVFADRTSFTFCSIGSASVGNESIQWQTFRGTTWTDAGTTSSNEIEITVGEWDRVKVRYRRCDPDCGPWSAESVTVIATPGIDADGSGQVTVNDVSLICRDAVNPSNGKRETNGGLYR